MKLVLSTFCNGIDILGEGFKKEGYCVVQAGDIKFGQDIKDFHVPSGKFDIVIGGPSCTEFSGLNRNPDIEKGMSLIREFCRVVMEAAPDCFLMENVVRVPNIPAEWIEGYTVQRFNLSPRECGNYAQLRNRTFQFGFLSGAYLDIKRESSWREVARCVTASEGKQTDRRTFADVCELQGLTRSFKIQGFTKAAEYDAVGNCVHLAVARRVAAAIRERSPFGEARAHTLCACNCGRFLTGKQKAATDMCRKRLQKMRKGENARLV